MVKASRLQSALAPRRLSCLRIVPPDSSFHCQTLSKNFSRPRSCRVFPSLRRRRSTTTWVAIPAWSVPGSHTASNPRMRL